MRPQASASPDDSDLTTLFATLRRSVPKLIALSLITGALTYLTLSLIAPRYTAQSELGIVAKGKSNPFKAPNAQGSSDSLSAPLDEQAVNTHLRAIQSPDLLDLIANDMRLSGRPEFNPVLGPVDTMTGVLRTIGLSGTQSQLSEGDRVLNEVSRRLVVYSPEASRAIMINFTSIDPKLAADFANRLAIRYREKLANTTLAETNAVQEKFAPRIAKLQTEVQSSEAKVATFRAKAGLLRGGFQKTPINEQQLGDITTELTRVRSQRSAAEARSKTARNLMRQGTPEIIPAVQRSPLIQNLIAQRVTVERALLKRSASLKSAHPDMKQLRADLSAVNQQIAGEVANIVAGLDKEAFVMAEQEQAVVASLEKVKSKVAVNSTDEVELRGLEAVATSKRIELERLQAKYEANRAHTENGPVPVEAQIITLARPQSIAGFPRKTPYTLLVMVATLLLGTAIVITAGLANCARGAPRSEQRPREEIAAAAATPPIQAPPLSEGSLVLATQQPAVDTVSGDLEGNDPVTLISNTSDLAEHLLQNSKTATTGFRTLIASKMNPVTTAGLAVKTASELNRSGKQTMIIDWNLEGAGIARQLNLPKAPGFIELIQAGASFPEVVRWVPGTQVHFIASGRAIAEGPIGLDADQLNLILDALDEAYDHIVVVGQTKSARILFEAIQGRFDAGVIVSEPGYEQSDPQGTFLGFEVADIDLVRFEHTRIQPENAA